MIAIKVKGLEATIKRLADINKKILPNVVAKSLTKTAMKVKDNIKGAMTHHFDRPTSYTMNSVYLKGATDKSWEATVWLKDRSEAGKGGAASDYLYAQVYGGKRKHTRFEGLLISKRWLPQNYYAVPGPGATFNQYGNISAGQYTQMLAALGALPGRPTIQGKEVPVKEKSKAVRAMFAIRAPAKGHLSPGVYQYKARSTHRGIRGIRCIMVFTPKIPTYAKKLPFQLIAQKTKDLYLKRTIREEFAKRINKNV